MRTVWEWGKLLWEIDTAPAFDALDQAMSERPPAPGPDHLPERGVQIASAVRIARLNGIKILVINSATENSYENAKTESFFKAPKREGMRLNNF